MRGGYWRTNHQLARADQPNALPSVIAVIPARNEAAVLPRTLPSILRQTYAGLRAVIVVDDRSGDRTAAVAAAVGADEATGGLLRVIRSGPLPAGWAGKVHALHQGVQAGLEFNPDYIFAADADIACDDGVLASLVAAAERDHLDLVSVMAELRSDRFWERLLIPAFVYFFGMVYPFGWTNSGRGSAPGAAGGCVLVRRTALEAAGGYESIRSAVIDDCALAARIRDCGRAGGKSRLWLGLSHRVRSVREYGGIGGVREMVARTAFDQLNYSWLRVTGTVAGMALLFALPPVGTLAGAIALLAADGDSLAAALLTGVSASGWAVMAALYAPMLLYYRQKPIWALAMPLTGGIYAAMTISSAIRPRSGTGGDRAAA